MRLIDADELLKALDAQLNMNSSGTDALLVGFAKQLLNLTPTAEVEPIVRCKDCKHCFLEIIEGQKVFSCLYRTGTLDLNGYCDCGVLKCGPK